MRKEHNLRTRRNKQTIKQEYVKDRKKRREERKRKRKTAIRRGEEV